MRSSPGARLPSKSKTPDTVVARDLAMDIKRLGDQSRFVRTAPGRYAVRELAHLVKGASATLGMTRIAAAAGALEGGAQHAQAAPAAHAVDYR